jgi:Tol biopolymer transport system component
MSTTMTTIPVTSSTTTTQGRRGVAMLATFALIAGFGLATADHASASAYPGTNGKIVFTSNRADSSIYTDVYTMNPDGTGTTRLTNDPDVDWSPTFSADGTKIAYERTVLSGGDPANGGIWVMNADGSNQHLVDGLDGSPTWSPDGTKLAVVDRATSHIYVINSDGTGRTELTSSADGYPQWSPDGTKIAFESTRDGSAPQIYVMGADGSNQTRLTNDDDLDGYPSWSPDGSKIAFWHLAYPEATDSIVVMSADGTGQAVVVGSTFSPTKPAWSPDGTRIAFEAHVDADGTGSMWLVTAPGYGNGVQRLSAGPDPLRFYDDYLGDWQPVPNQAPTITPASGTVVYGDPISPLSVTASDPDGDSLVLDATGLPVGLVFTDNGNGTGTVSGTATAAPGAYPVTYSASDGVNAPVTAGGTITVAKEDCTLAYTGDLYVAPGANANLKAHFDEADTTKGDLSNHTVVFDLVDSTGATYAQHPSATTNGSGDAAAALALPVGVYAVTAHFDGDAFYSACRATDAVMTVASAQSKITGAGWIAVQTRTSFGFNLVSQAGGPWTGQFQVRIASTKGQFAGTSINTVTFTGTNKATWTGSGKYNGVAGYSYRATVVDNGTSTKTPDKIEIVITSPTNQTIFTTSGLQALRGGNLAIVQ